MKSNTDLRGKRVTILGMGRSALGAVRLLLREQAIPFVSDAGDDAALDDLKTQLTGLGVPFEAGGHSAEAFARAELIVPSPSVPDSLPALDAARKRGVPVWGELELGARFCTSRILAVSGTNGKTTTTELLRAIISTCGHSAGLAGNNATALSAAVLADPQPEYMVLEVSSYQLETVAQFHPWITAVLNLTPDHLGRHGTMHGYAAAKERLFQRQGAGDFAVLNADDTWVKAMNTPPGVRVRCFSASARRHDGLWVNGDVIYDGVEPIASVRDTPLPGRHNLDNVLCALTMMRAGGFNWEGVLAGVRTFRGVEHRIEPVLDVKGIEVFNDSKSTNVDSLRVALESFKGPVVLIAGGRGKGSSYQVLRALVAARVKKIVALGEDATQISDAFSSLVPCESAADMRDAVRKAYEAAEAGDTILLSPACASFDMYRNFEERGRDFKRLARELAPGTATLRELTA